MSLLSSKHLSNFNKYLGMCLILMKMNTVIIDQVADIEEMLDQNGLMEEYGVKVPIGKEINDHDIILVYLLANGVQMASQIYETFSRYMVVFCRSTDS